MCWMTVFLSKIQKQHTFSAIIFTVLVNTISFVEAQNAANESTENCPSYQSEQTSQSTAAKWEHLHFLSSKQFWVFIIRSKDSNFPCLHLQWSWMPTVELWYQANALVFLRLIIFIMFRRCMPIRLNKGSQVWRQQVSTNNTTSCQPSLSTTYDKWFPRAYNKLHIKQWKMLLFWKRSTEVLKKFSHELIIMHEAHGGQWQGNAATTDYGTFHKRVILKMGTGNGNMELWLDIWTAFCLGEDELEH